jgi:L-lactate dehydrogenase complex protein LldG
VKPGANPILDAVRRSLGHQSTTAPRGRPAVVPPRAAQSPNQELGRLLEEVQALGGETRQLSTAELDAALQELVSAGPIRTATLWRTSLLGRLGVARRLSALGVEVVAPDAGKHELARCDLGITEVDFALAETGTLGLLSAPDRPRQVSLLPRIHLGIMNPGALRADLHQVFAEARGEPYLILISGPSRTADIELTVTLGVHGPSALHLWSLVAE